MGVDGGGWDNDGKYIQRRVESYQCKLSHLPVSRPCRLAGLKFDLWWFAGEGKGQWLPGSRASMLLALCGRVGHFQAMNVREFRGVYGVEFVQ